MEFTTTRDNVNVECTFDPTLYGLTETDILDTAVALIQNVKSGGGAKLNMGIVNYTLLNSAKGKYVYVTTSGSVDFDTIGEDDLYFTDFGA